MGWELCEADGPGFLGYHPQPGDVCVWPRGERFSVAVWQGVQGDPARTYEVSRPAFEVAALLELRGVQALDWPCEECGGGRDLWHYSVSVGESMELEAAGWRIGPEIDVPVTGQHDFHHVRVNPCTTPCPACTIDGKPTGRRRVPAFEAVLMGEPRQGYNVINGVRKTWTEPDHEGARAALRKLAEGWREHLPVLADWLDFRGYFDTSEREEAIRKWAASRDGPLELADWLGAYGGDGGASSPLGACPCVPRPLAECPALPTWVLAWLAGECPECRGRGGWQEGHRGDDWSDCWACKTTGLALGPHLEAIRAHLAEAWQGATAECGGCRGAGLERLHLGRGTQKVEACTRCAGLGRVKLEPEDT
jgi:hypothetical protein